MIETRLAQSGSTDEQQLSQSEGMREMVTLESSLKAFFSVPQMENANG